MDPLALSLDALREPWRLWTCHLAHFGWEHALANLVALAVPALLVPSRERGRLLLVLLLTAPLLSLLLLSGLGQGQYRGASGLACVAWAWVGLRLASRRESLGIGHAMLGGLALKLALENFFGRGLLAPHHGWQTLPAAHVWGALLGLAAAVPELCRRHHDPTRDLISGQGYTGNPESPCPSSSPARPSTTAWSWARGSTRISPPCRPATGSRGWR